MRKTNLKKQSPMIKLTSSNKCEGALNDFAKMSEIVQKLRNLNSFYNKSEMNPFVIWFAPTKNVFSAHLMGVKLSSENFDDLIELCKQTLLDIYNEWAMQEKIIESPIKNINHVIFRVPYSKMTKDMLIDQIENLQNKLNEVLLKIDANKEVKNDQAKEHTKAKRNKSKAVALAN